MFPLGEIDTERLGEAADNVEDQSEPLGLAGGPSVAILFLPAIVLRCCLALASVLGRIYIGNL